MNRYALSTRASFVALALSAGFAEVAKADTYPSLTVLASADIMGLLQDDEISLSRKRRLLLAPEGPMPDGRALASLYPHATVQELAEAAPVAAVVPVKVVAPPVALLAQVDPPVVEPTKAPEPLAKASADSTQSSAPAAAKSSPVSAAADAPVEMAQASAPMPIAAAAPAADSASADLAEVTKPATANGEVESLRDAIVASLKSNPDIQIALAKQDDARFAVDQARSAYFPHLDITAGYGPEITHQGGKPGEWNKRLEGTVSLNQNVWDFGATINDIKRARASYRSAQWATREQIEGISFEITNAYVGMLQQQKMIDLTNEEIAATQKLMRMVTVQKDLGLTTQADVDRAKARLDNLQSTLLDRQSILAQAKEAYKRLTNRIPGKAVDLPPTDTVLPESAEAAVAMIDDHSPKMAQAVQDRRSLAKQLASQTGSFFPKVGLQVQGNHKYDVMGQTGLVQDARAMVTVSYSFLNGGSDLALKNRIAARVRQADYELERRRREVEQDIRIDFQSLTAARQKISTIRSEIDAAQNVADLYKQQFREGKRSVFDLLDSQQVLFNARSNAVGNEMAMRLAEYRVLQKLGGLFDLVSGSEPLPKLALPASENHGN